MSNETTALTTVQSVEGNKPGLVSTLAEFFGVAPAMFLSSIRGQCFPKGQATTEQLLAFLVVVNEYRLNPYLKEIYAFPDKWGNVKPVVSVDGWVSLVNRHQNNDGFEFEEKLGTDGKPIESTCIMWVKGRSHPVKITEVYAECYRETDPWKDMPRRMLRHKSLIQAARYAFGFSGIQDEDEARDAITVEPLKPPPAVIPPAGVADIEQQKKIAEYHKLADAAGWNNAQKHMTLGKHEGNLDAAIAEVKSLTPAPEAASKPATQEQSSKKGRGRKPSAAPAPEQPAEPAKPEEPPSKDSSTPTFGF
jgi:phage recombination protein Bet